MKKGAEKLGSCEKRANPEKMVLDGLYTDNELLINFFSNVRGGG